MEGAVHTDHKITDSYSTPYNSACFDIEVMLSFKFLSLLFDTDHSWQPFLVINDRNHLDTHIHDY